MIRKRELDEIVSQNVEDQSLQIFDDDLFSEEDEDEELFQVKEMDDINVNEKNRDDQGLTIKSLNESHISIKCKTVGRTSLLYASTYVSQFSILKPNLRVSYLDENQRLKEECAICV